MKMRTKLALTALGLVVVVGGGAAVSSRKASAGEGTATVKVTRADIVDKALAVGTIEPEISVSVKSKVSGVVSRSLAEAGDYVAAGQPLLEIRPDPTPLELVEARRDVELKGIELANFDRDLVRQKALTHRGLAPEQELEKEMKTNFFEARRAETLGKLALGRGQMTESQNYFQQMQDRHEAARDAAVRLSKYRRMRAVQVAKEAGNP